MSSTDGRIHAFVGSAWRTIAVVAAIGVGTVAAGITVTGGSSGGGVTCDQTLTTRAQVSTAMTSTSSAGKTLCVTASITGAEIATSTAMPSQARFIAQPADGTVRMVGVTFNSGAARMTLEGFEFTGNTGIGFVGTSNGIRYVRNYCHDQASTCIVAYNGSVVNGLEVLGSRFVNIVFNGSFPNGYGVYTAGGTWTNLKFNYNYCTNDGRSADCAELGGMNGFEIIGNEIYAIQDATGGTAHADGIMTWSGSKNGLIKDNVSLDGEDWLISPDGSDTRIENNLIARQDQICVDAHPNATSGNVQPLRFTFVNNTFWGCGAGGLQMNGALGARGGNVVQKNVFDGMTCVTGGITTFDHNLLNVNPGCGGGTNVFTYTPNWGGTNVAGRGATYQPTNLPPGYEDVGYKPAPYGPAACPC